MIVLAGKVSTCCFIYESRYVVEVTLTLRGALGALVREFRYLGGFVTVVVVASSIDVERCMPCDT